jgi:hypothetical protein
MARLTKNSYRRKIVVFGLLVFMSIALISTGFAAWVMSQGAKEETSGNVTIGVVEDGRITLSNLVYKPVVNKYNDDYSDTVELTGTDYDIATSDGLNFKFEPLFNDKNGAITWEGIKEVDGVKSTSCEIMEIQVSGFVTNHHLLNGGVLNIELTVSKGVYDCIQEGYITVPDGFTLKEASQDGRTYIYKMDIKPNDNGIFNFTVKFNWGTKFNGSNPAGTVHDNAETTNSELDLLKAQIEAFRAILFGYYEDGTSDGLRSINVKLEAANEARSEAIAADPNADISALNEQIKTLETQKAALINAEYQDSYKLTIIAATQN